MNVYFRLSGRQLQLSTYRVCVAISTGFLMTSMTVVCGSGTVVVAKRFGGYDWSLFVLANDIEYAVCRTPSEELCR